MADLQTREQMLADIAPRNPDMKAKPYMTDTSKIEELLERLEKMQHEFSRIEGASRHSNASTVEEAATTIRALLEAVTDIACFDDRQANEYLERHGTYAAFDEPASVKRARQALQETDNAG